MPPLSPNKIVLLTGPGSFFGQGKYPWQSVNLEALRALLEEHCEVSLGSFDEVDRLPSDVSDLTILHTSSQQPHYKQFIDDILLWLHLRGARLIPGVALTRAHENKGFQELLKSIHGYTAFNGVYVANPDLLPELARSLPAVVKATSGFGSTSVQLAGKVEEVRQIMSPQPSPMARLTHTLRRLVEPIARKILNRPAMFGKERPWGHYYESITPVVIQEFSPGLDGDYKVVISGRHAIVTHRKCREGDWRASGSGRFSFPEKPPVGLLDFCSKFRSTMNAAWLSIDVAITKQGPAVIEFQGSHFGPIFIMRTTHHFKRASDGHWSISSDRLSLEEFLGFGVISFLEEAKPHGRI